MMKLVIICSVLANSVLARSFEEFEINNMIDIDEEPYQVATFPYPYQENRINWVYKPTVVKEKTDVVKVHPATEMVVAKHGLVFSVISYTMKTAKSAVECLMNNGTALLIGSLLAFGICQITSLCSAISLSDAERELKFWASTDRFKRAAAEFLEEAVTKYTAIQNVTS